MIASLQAIMTIAAIRIGLRRERLFHQWNYLIQKMQKLVVVFRAFHPCSIADISVGILGGAVHRVGSTHNNPRRLIGFNPKPPIFGFKGISISMQLAAIEGNMFGFASEVWIDHTVGTIGKFEAISNFALMSKLEVWPAVGSASEVTHLSPKRTIPSGKRWKIWEAGFPSK